MQKGHLEDWLLYLFVEKILDHRPSIERTLTIGNGMCRHVSIYVLRTEQRAFVACESRAHGGSWCVPVCHCKNLPPQYDRQACHGYVRLAVPVAPLRQGTSEKSNSEQKLRFWRMLSMGDWHCAVPAALCFCWPASWQRV
eukprot:6212839-Pleurochrysis_carterae.AAC.4